MTPIPPQPEDSVDDAGWFDAAYRDHFDYVWHSVRRLGARSGDVEDLVHDIFVTLYHTRARVDRRRALRPWIFGITARKLSDYRRQARFRREVAARAREPADPAPLPPELVDQRRKRALVLAALEELPYPQRVIFVMVELQGHSVVEASRALEEKENTLYSRLRLARKAFATAAKRQLASSKGASC